MTPAATQSQSQYTCKVQAMEGNAEPDNIKWVDRALSLRHVMTGGSPEYTARLGLSGLHRGGAPQVPTAFLAGPALAACKPSRDRGGLRAAAPQLVHGLLVSQWEAQWVARLLAQWGGPWVQPPESDCVHGNGN